MTQKKTINYTTKLTFTIEGIDDYQEALSDVNDCFAIFKESASKLQEATNRLNAIEIKINSE